MEYKRLKRMLRIIAIVFVIFLMVSIIRLMILFHEEAVPIGNQYTLDEIEEEQAVMGIYLYDTALVVDKKGRWKYADIEEVTEEVDHRDILEFFDAILRDEDIPYQEYESEINEEMLTKAINVCDFGLPMESIYVDKVIPLTFSEYNYYVITGTGEERHEVLIGRDGTQSDARWDVNLVFMRYKLGRLFDEAFPYDRKKYLWEW